MRLGVRVRFPIFAEGRSEAPYPRGSVVLVPFPFTDLSGRKRRPALVASPESFHEENIIPRVLFLLVVLSRDYLTPTISLTFSARGFSSRSLARRASSSRCSACRIALSIMDLRVSSSRVQ